MLFSRYKLYFSAIVGIVICTISPTFVSCEKDEIYEEDWQEDPLGEDDPNAEEEDMIIPGVVVFDPWEEEEDTLIHDQPTCEGMRYGIEKAYFMAEVEWTPLSNVPSLYTEDYSPGELRRGIPYSSTKVVNAFVGLDVSFYTFLTAVHNPLSVMYTENLKKAPYNAYHCATYYGTICNASLMYVMGIREPFYPWQFDVIPNMKKMPSVKPETIAVGDIMWTKTHVAMVIDIGRDKTGKIIQLKVFETTTSQRLDACIRKYSLEAFSQRWEKGGFVCYRYTGWANNTKFDEPLAIVGGQVVPTFAYNNDICTNRGDKVTYCEHYDTVVINILNMAYDSLELYHGENRYTTRAVKTPIEVFRDLPYGEYKARLKRGHVYSDYTRFEVINTSVNVTVEGNLKVSFSSANGNPIYVEICNKTHGVRSTRIISSTERNNGYLTRSLLKDPNYKYIKVHFKGQYGMACPPRSEIME